MFLYNKTNKKSSHEKSELETKFFQDKTQENLFLKKKKKNLL